MPKQFKKALFLFRRDLRLEDNTGLLFALKNAELVIPAFICTKEQLFANPYRSDRCVQFMIESLEDLQQQLHNKNGRFYLFLGKTEEIVNRLIQSYGIDLVAVNRDYTPYSQTRDRQLNELCQKKGVPFHSFEDALLHPVDEITKKDGNPYTIFTPFFQNACKKKVIPPQKNRKTNYYTKPISFAEEFSIYKKILPQRQTQAKGGRKEALCLLKKIGEFAKVPYERDLLSKSHTTLLSAHLKFTTCSVREIYVEIVKHLGPHAELLRSLYWRDFFSSIAFYFPRVFEGPFHEKWRHLHWNNHKQPFDLWCQGQTGVPIVDAGMREMNQTGYMQNRVRMITASFLVKDLHIDWRSGERYFAQKLIDYDPAINNGNWQWVASTGCDAQPYFRIMNPWIQQKKFDPDCMYIKKWIPELSAHSSKEIHAWNGSSIYPAPIVDHAREAKIALDHYKKVSRL